MQVPKLTQRLVLVADDNLQTQRLLSQALAHIDLVTLPVSDGAGAIVAVAMQRADFICAILDIQMPTVNGIDAAHAIRRAAPDLPIVLMSDRPLHAYANQIQSLQLAGVLQKPFTVEIVQKLLIQTLGNAIAIGKERAIGE